MLKTDNPLIYMDQDVEGLHANVITIASSGNVDTPKRGFSFELHRYWTSQEGKRDWVPLDKGGRIRPPACSDTEAWIISQLKTQADFAEYQQVMATLDALIAQVNNKAIYVAMAYLLIRHGIAEYATRTVAGIGTVEAV